MMIDSMNNSNIKLITFDLDGTLLRDESVCEVLAKHLGHLDRMREFEKLRNYEEIKEARQELVKYYLSQPKEDLISILEFVTFAPGTYNAFNLLKKSNVYTSIVSITFQFAVEVIGNKLGADYYIGTSFNDQGDITHFWPEDKGKWLENLIRSLNIKFDEVAAVGDSWGDVYMLNKAKYSYFVGKDKPEGLNAIHRPEGDIYKIIKELI